MMGPHNEHILVSTTAIVVVALVLSMSITAWGIDETDATYDAAVLDETVTVYYKDSLGAWASGTFYFDGMTSQGNIEWSCSGFKYFNGANGSYSKPFLGFSRNIDGSGDLMPLEYSGSMDNSPTMPSGTVYAVYDENTEWMERNDITCTVGDTIAMNMDVIGQDGKNLKLQSSDLSWISHIEWTYKSGSYERHYSRVSAIAETEGDYYITWYYYNLEDDMGMTVTVYIQVNAPPTYDVSFSSEGSVIHTETVEPNSKVQSYTPPAREGYTFDGWYADVAFQTPFDFNTSINSNITLYAKWIAKPVVTFWSDGSAIHTVMMEPGSKVSEITPPTREGYTFGGWYSDSGCTTPFNFDTAINSDITLYAKWIENPVIITFMVGEERHSTLAVPRGSVGVVYTPLMVTGVFAGWYYDADFTEKYDATRVLDGDITLYALGVPPLVFTSEPNATANIQQVNSYNMFFFDATDSSGRYQIEWDFGDGNTSTDAITYNTYATPGLYTVTLKITNLYGETSTATYDILVKDPAGGGGQ